jgi:hypothetical protein
MIGRARRRRIVFPRCLPFCFFLDELWIGLCVWIEQVLILLLLFYEACRDLDNAEYPSGKHYCYRFIELIIS